MTARLKLPAFGKQLLNERREGRHPPVVHVHYCETLGCSAWCDDCERARSAPAALKGGLAQHPSVQVTPAEFAPYRYDWRLVTGCKVALFDWRDDIFAAAQRFYELVGELGRLAGPVHVYRLEAEPPLHGQVVAWRFRFAWDAGALAGDLFKQSGSWPSWWPRETETVNEPRRRTWWEHFGASREPRAA